MHPPARTRPFTADGLTVALGAAVALAWAVVFPYSGDADATFHYLNARDGLAAPGEILSPWARPLFKAYLLLPAQLGIFASRAAMTLVFAALMQQTIALARDLARTPPAEAGGPSGRRAPAGRSLDHALRRPWLAGLFLLLLPTVFGLATDTMSEIPFALGAVVAVRLWVRPGGAARFLVASTLVVALLPLVRPEGFWFAAMWGVMILVDRRLTPAQRLTLPALLAAGILLWMFACLICNGDAFYFLKHWSWPAQSYETYGRGSLLHHVYRWPVFCGPVMLVLFVAGIVPSARRPMALPWAVWLLVFVLHSVLYWRGWFASVGLMRILASTAPFTALICLFGWNAIADRLARWGWRDASLRRVAWTTLAIAAVVPPVHYVLNAQHLRMFPSGRCVRFVLDHELLDSAPALVVSDKLALAQLGLPPHPRIFVENSYDPPAQRRMLATRPVGTIGIWDNQRGVSWYHLTVDDLSALGYTVLHEAKLTTTISRKPPVDWRLADLIETQRYVVVRKER